MLKTFRRSVSRFKADMYERYFQKDVEGFNISKRYIARLLPSDPVIIDCGAHIGDDSLKLAQIPHSTVYAFEAVPEIYQRLVQRTSKRNNIKCLPLALSHYSGEAEFYVSSGGSDGSSSLLKPKQHIKDHPDVHFSSVIKVRCLTLDDWADKEGIQKVDMLWLDMQGAEQIMLEQSKKILETVKVIHSEISTRETYEGVKPYAEFRSFLEGKGFKVLLEAIPAGADMGNVLFQRQ